MCTVCAEFLTCVQCAPDFAHNHKSVAPSSRPPIHTSQPHTPVPCCTTHHNNYAAPRSLPTAAPSGSGRTGATQGTGDRRTAQPAASGRVVTSSREGAPWAGSRHREDPPGDTATRHCGPCVGGGKWGGGLGEWCVVAVCCMSDIDGGGWVNAKGCSGCVPHPFHKHPFHKNTPFTKTPVSQNTPFTNTLFTKHPFHKNTLHTTPVVVVYVHTNTLSHPQQNPKPCKGTWFL